MHVVQVRFVAANVAPMQACTRLERFPTTGFRARRPLDPKAPALLMEWQGACVGGGGPMDDGAAACPDACGMALSIVCVYKGTR